MTRPAAAIGAGAFKLAFALVAGWLFYTLHVPLAWLLGPLLASAAIGLSGRSMPVSTRARRLGQIIIGMSIGLHVTASVVRGILPWVPVMIGWALLSILASALLSTWYARLARIDAKSAYYALLPGGLAEMANIGLGEGAKPEPITISQTLRVSLVVLIVPPAISALGIDGGFAADSPGLINWVELPFLIAVGTIGVFTIRATGIKNAWMTGSLIAVGLASATGWVSGHIIPAVLWVAQFLIGIAIGARFQRDQFASLPRVVFFGAVMVMAMTSLSAACATVLAHASGVDISTLALALAPGGIAEMASTAQAMHLSLVLITGFHLVRALIVNGFASHLRQLLVRLAVLNP